MGLAVPEGEGTGQEWPGDGEREAIERNRVREAALLLPPRLECDW
jgi:hypothetical protein